MSGRKRREVKGKREMTSPPPPKTTGGNLGKGGNGKTPKGSNHASPRPGGGGGGANNTNNNGNGPKKGSSHHKRTDNPPPALTETQQARSAALEELLQTESDYCADLDTFIQIYLEPLRGSTIISPEDVKMIFGNVEDIWLGNMKLLQSLESARKALPSNNRPMMHMLKVGDIFVAVAQRGAFIAYPAYCNNYEAASARAEELAEENATFAAFLKGAQNDAAARHMNLYDFLSKPFQRILKYPLLLKEVLKHSPRGNTEYAALQKALTLMENIAADANSARRVLDIAGSMDGVPRYLQLDVTTARRVVREGSALVNKDERQLVLFTDILLISKGSGKKSKYERHLELHQLSLQPVPKADDSLELMDTANKGAVYTLRWKGNDDLRNVWYETLETYIARAIEAFQPSSAVGVGAFTSLFASGKSLQDRVRGLLGGGAGTGSTRVPPVETPSMSGKGGTELALFAMPGVGVGSSSSAKGSFRTGPGGMSTGGGGGLGAGAGVGASMKSMGSTRGVDRPKGGSRKAMAWHLEKLTELKGRIEGLPDDFELIDAERRFLREGPLLKISEGKHTDRVFILFSDVLIYGEAAKAKKSGGEILRFKKMIWLHEAHVKEYEATGATQSVYSNLAFQVERLEAKVTKTYTLKAETVADKEAWMKDLQAAIEKMKARRGTRDDESTRPGGAGSTDVDGSVAPMLREADRGYILNDYEMRLKDFPPYPERPEGMSDEIWSLTEKAYAAKKEVAIEDLKMEDAKAKRKALERQERALRATLSATRKALEEFRALLDADLDNVLVLLDRTHKPKGEGRSRRKGGGGSGRKAGGGSARRGPSAPKGPKK